MTLDPTLQRFIETAAIDSDAVTLTDVLAVALELKYPDVDLSAVVRDYLDAGGDATPIRNVVTAHERHAHHHRKSSTLTEVWASRELPTPHFIAIDGVTYSGSSLRPISDADAVFTLNTVPPSDTGQIETAEPRKFSGDTPVTLSW